MIDTEKAESFTSVILKRLREPWWKVLAEAGVEGDLFSKVHIKRDEFRQICASILDRMKKPLEKVLLEAGLSVQDISSVELVGSSSLRPIIVQSITEFFGKMPRRSMNKRGSVAKGCALMCELLSKAPEAPRFLLLAVEKDEVLFAKDASKEATVSDTDDASGS